MNERNMMMERLVALSGGKPFVRRAYASFSDADLATAVADAEHAARDIARYGRLGVVWQDAGGEIVVRAEPGTEARTQSDNPSGPMVQNRGLVLSRP